jgi:hypothetical protein
VTIAAGLLLLLVLGLLVHDWTTVRGRNRRVLWVETAVFVIGAFFIAFPDRATELAHMVGIQRGVDFLLYPIVIWLVRETLLTRRRHLEDRERLTQLTRALAVVEARAIGAPVSASPSGSRTAAP